MGTDKEFVETLERQVKRYEEELEELLSQRRLLEAEISQTRDCLERTKALREVEARRVEGGNYRLAGMSVIEACSVVLRERGRMTKTQIVAALKEGGFIFDNPYPLKTVHVALIRKPYFRKNDNATYEYVPDEDDRVADY